MKVVLFCGGMGTRLGGIPDNVPKPMVKIGYRPILWHIMRYYAHFGHREFILCLGYKADAIKEYFLNYNEYISNDFTMTNGGKDLSLMSSDIGDWKISFIDTGLKANIGQRLKAVESYLGDDPMFLANYADGMTSINLTDMINFFYKSGKIACFMCAKPSQSFHIVDVEDEGIVKEIKYVRDSKVLINAGFFIFKREIFNYINPGEELVLEPFQRLIAEKQLIGYRCDNFWCMDTFKEHQELNDMFNKDAAPWEVWKTHDRVKEQKCNGAL
jgi:glucose-1-phosphate cytidylyltransferase